MSDELTRKEYIDVPLNGPIVVFEIHKDERNRIYTSRFMVGRDRSRVQEVASKMMDALVERYNFYRDYLLVMSSDEPDGIWVWVRSIRPIPPKRLTTGETHTTGVETNVFRPRLGGGDPNVIDI